MYCVPFQLVSPVAMYTLSSVDARLSPNSSANLPKNVSVQPNLSSITTGTGLSEPVRGYLYTLPSSENLPAEENS